jgi:anti-anti-sigma factor
VFGDVYPVRWMGRQAIVALPEHIDVSNASQIREELLWLINRGASPLIVDMTATLSCDQSGAAAVMRAHQRALASDTQLRLVVTAQIVHRVLGINGLDRLISVYPCVEAATAAGTPSVPVTLNPGGPYAPQPRNPTKLS